jgi:hypothetical protein
LARTGRGGVVLISKTSRELAALARGCLSAAQTFSRMGFFYTMAFLFCAALTALATFASKETRAEEIKSRAFKRFQNNYLRVYYLMMAADWLQGPYVYALYSSYGFSHSDIAKLFVAGFGSRWAGAGNACCAHHLCTVS